MILSDLVPPEIPQSAIDTSPQVHTTEDDASRSTSVYKLLGKADGAPMSQAIRPREATLPKAGNPEIASSSILQKEQKQSAEKPFPATPEDSETQQTSPKDHPATPTVEASHKQYLFTPSGKPVAPLPIQPALPISIPSLPRDDLSEQRVSRDDIPGKVSSSSMHPHIQSPSIPVHMERFIAPDPDVDESLSNDSKSKGQAKVDEQPEAASQPLNGIEEHTIKPRLGQNAVAKERDGQQSHSEVSTPEGTPPAKARLRVPFDSEMVHSISPIQPSNVHEALHSSRADSKLEAPGVEAESEVFPINVTIGRIVVRATQAAQPTPVKKRVLHPAQSLDEYLKQRERGSR
jgi:hypothetical protein